MQWPSGKLAELNMMKEQSTLYLCQLIENSTSDGAHGWRLVFGSFDE
jgi:hypothetical protein